MDCADICRILNRAGLLDCVFGELRTGEVKGCSFDSRDVKRGDLFFCKGSGFKPEYLNRAANAGALAFVFDREDLTTTARSGEGRLESCTGFMVCDVRRAMSLLSPYVYDHPDRDVKIIGVTGTKGKTTTAYMLKSIFEAAGDKVGIIGSIFTEDGIESAESHNTTPEAPEVWRHLANCRQTGRRYMVMEVSSQALKYGRVDGLDFDVAAFLNIGYDHISALEHSSFEDYFSSKLKIFSQCRQAVVNLGSDEAERILSAAAMAAEGEHQGVVTFGVDCPAADAQASSIRYAGDGAIVFDLSLSSKLSDSSEGGPHPVELGIAGQFNVENALCAISIARLCGVSIDHIKEGLKHLRVPGRMEVLSSPGGNVVAIVDYAHNRLSFEALYRSVQAQYSGYFVISVFGAAGDKAKERRRDLPLCAAPASDLIIYTEEDPAHEDLAHICDELVASTPASTPCKVILDREAAIRYAFERARTAGKKALVLLLAKGDETFQHRGDEFPHVRSDLDLARELIRLC